MFFPRCYRYLECVPQGHFRFPQDDLCRFFSNFTGESNALLHVFWRFECHAMGQGTAAEAAVPAGKKVVQFPGKAKAPVNSGIARSVPAKDHPDRHNATGHCTTGSSRHHLYRWETRMPS